MEDIHEIRLSRSHHNGIIPLARSLDWRVDFIITLAMPSSCETCASDWCTASLNSWLSRKHWLISSSDFMATIFCKTQATKTFFDAKCRVWGLYCPRLEIRFLDLYPKRPLTKSALCRRWLNRKSPFFRMSFTTGFGWFATGFLACHLQNACFPASKDFLADLWMSLLGNASIILPQSNMSISSSSSLTGANSSSDPKKISGQPTELENTVHPIIEWYLVLIYSGFCWVCGWVWRRCLGWCWSRFSVVYAPKSPCTNIINLSNAHRPANIYVVVDPSNRDSLCIYWLKIDEAWPWWNMISRIFAIRWRARFYGREEAMMRADIS